jgi:hypothetical protein
MLSKNYFFSDILPGKMGDRLIFWPIRCIFPVLVAVCEDVASYKEDVSLDAFLVSRLFLCHTVV